MMAIYDFKCDECGQIQQNVIMPITHDYDDLPECCNEKMDYYITRPPMVHWVDPVIEPFRAIATKDMPVISTTRENREYMARNNLVDANELGPPPTYEEQEKTAAEMQKSIDAITPTGQVADEMKKRGMLDIVDS